MGAERQPVRERPVQRPAAMGEQPARRRPVGPRVGLQPCPVVPGPGLDEGGVRSAVVDREPPVVPRPGEGEFGEPGPAEHPVRMPGRQHARGQHGDTDPAGRGIAERGERGGEAGGVGVQPGDEHIQPGTGEGVQDGVRAAVCRGLVQLPFDVRGRRCAGPGLRSRLPRGAAVRVRPRPRPCIRPVPRDHGAILRNGRRPAARGRPVPAVRRGPGRAGPGSGPGTGVPVRRRSSPSRWPSSPGPSRPGARPPSGAVRRVRVR
ncbi:hypothetical protein ACVWXU_003444 [Streptomyces sp. TE33382]